MGQVWADPTQLHQVLVNLCTNAGHAIGGRDGSIDLVLERVELDESSVIAWPDMKPGPHLRLSVKDSGYGMDKETELKIFNPFFTTKSKGVGTGLGLSVVHGIVAKHGGTIKVYSELGKGSLFSVYLPELQGDYETFLEQSQSRLPTGSEHLLVVDDEEMLLDVMEQLLGRLGYQVTSFTSPEKALKYFRENAQDVDLLLTDFTMPDMTGIQLVQQALAVKPKLPAILCTGYAKSLSEKSALEAGIGHIISKPFTQEGLATVIRELLNQARPGAKQLSCLLLVDDEKEIIETIKRLMKSSPVKILTAYSGEEAVEVFREHRDEIDIVVTDLSMPGIGGKETAMRILQIDPNAKVVISSGFSIGDPECQAMEGKIADFLPKPYSKADLLGLARLL